jgi:prolyl-tRNA synthetase
VPCEAGEDVLVTSDRGNYAADLAQAATGARPWDWGGDPVGDLEKVHTPGLASVADVARFLGVEPRRVLKTLVFRTGTTSPTLESGVNARWVVAVVRGDHEVNEAKLARAARDAFHVEGLHLADDEDVRARWTVGFVGPDAAIANLQAVLIVDPDAAQGGVDWAAGANEADHHVRHFNWFRECGQNLADPKKVVVADVRNARTGDPSPADDGGRLVLSPAIEVGHVSQHGTAYAEALNAYVQDEAGRQRPVMMGCCEVGIGRILAAAVEVRHDDRGIVWPAALAPYAVVVTPVRYDGETRSAADRVYGELVEAGIDVLLDDRDARPGSKFADADLIGFPVRLTIGERGLKEGKLELKRRAFPEPETLPMHEALEYVRRALG